MKKRLKNNKENLRDLLRKAETPLPEADAFEKEAMEGFSQLTGEDAEKLMDDVDRAVYEKVFSQKKKRPLLYWAAAAALIVLLGSSLYFILDDSISGLKRRDLAVMDQPGEKKPEPPVAFSENAEVVSNETEVSTGLKQEKRVERLNTATQVARDEFSGVASAGEAEGMALSEPAEEDNTEDLAAKYKVQPDKTDVAARQKDLESVKPVPTAINEDQTMRKEKYARSEETKRKKAEGRNQVQSAPPAAAAEDAVSTGSGGANAGCYFSGGDAALQTELKKKLTEKKISRDFEATLFVNAKGEVEKVEFSEKSELSKKEERQLRPVLLEMKGFVCEAITGDSLFRYWVRYRP